MRPEERDYVDERWAEGSFASTLPLPTPPLGPFYEEDTDPPTHNHSSSVPQNEKIQTLHVS